jgi:hypothetical protein
MELQPEALPFHEPDRCPPSPASDASEPALGEFRGNNLRGNHGRT